MEQPKGFIVARQEHLVSRFKKSLYVLKPTPRQSVGFSKSDEDHYLFMKTTQVGSPIFHILADSCTTQADHIRMQSSLYSDTWQAHKTFASSLVRTRTQVYSVTPTQTFLAMWTVQSQQSDTTSNSTMEQFHGSRNSSSARPLQRPRSNTQLRLTQ